MAFQDFCRHRPCVQDTAYGEMEPDTGYAWNRLAYERRGWRAGEESDASEGSKEPSFASDDEESNASERSADKKSEASGKKIEEASGERVAETWEMSDALSERSSADSTGSSEVESDATSSHGSSFEDGASVSSEESEACSDDGDMAARMEILEKLG